MRQGIAGLLGILVLAPLAAGETRQATGVKVGEVGPDSAIFWMRVTRDSARNSSGEVRTGAPKAVPAGANPAAFEGSATGAPGRVRLRWSPDPEMRNAQSTRWVPVDAARDYTHQFRLTGLSPDTRYHFFAETSSEDGLRVDEPLRGSFRTRPPEDRRADVTFTVITGMMYKDLDDRDGFRIFDSMLRVDPAFIVPTGDNVYYDNEDPRVTSAALARYHWQRMFSLPRLVAFFLRVPAYWEKDDHDTIWNDCWPSMAVPGAAPFTFEEGRRIFLEQVPMGEKTYRTFRWGRDLQIWLTEGRDFRSPNDAPDGPAKTIWGEEQKRWLQRTLRASTTRWRLLISPTPIVGPDRATKGDNHANAAFRSEGSEFRKWAAGNLPPGFFVVCGDRHWQYHSVDPATGVQEFSSGPASDEHAGGSPGEDPRYHRFHRVKGGFLSVSLRDSRLAFRFHDTAGAVVYEWSP